MPLLNKNCHRHPGLPVLALRARLPGPAHLPVPLALRGRARLVRAGHAVRRLLLAEMLKCDKFPEGDVCIAMTRPACEASKLSEAGVPRGCVPELGDDALGPARRPRSPRWCPAGRPRTAAGRGAACPGNPVSRKQSFISGSQESAFLPWEEASPHRSLNPDRIWGWGGNTTQTLNLGSAGGPSKC